MQNEQPQPLAAGRGRYRLSPWGSDLAIDVAGPDVAACVDAGVRGLAAALTSSGAAPQRLVTAEVEGAEPVDVLVDVLNEAIVRLDADGELVVRVEDLRPAEGTATLGVVDLGTVAVTGVAPKAATWHEARLAQDDTGWVGRVIVDL